MDANRLAILMSTCALSIQQLTDAISDLDKCGFADELETIFQQLDIVVENLEERIEDYG